MLHTLTQGGLTYVVVTTSADVEFVGREHYSENNFPQASYNIMQ
jgi:hypothetical protein